MVKINLAKIKNVIRQNKSELLALWVDELENGSSRLDLITEEELRTQSAKFLDLFWEAIQKGDIKAISGGNWEEARELLKQISRSRNFQGFTPTETAQFIFSLKQPLVAILQQHLSQEHNLQDYIWQVTVLLDKLGLYTCEMYIKAGEEVIAEQQQELLELSTPAIQLWEGVLALPLIGTLDSARAQTVMQNLLQKIVETGSEYAIIDITGVPMVDTLVAQHLLKTVVPTRLMGTECLISGIRPQIAQTIVQLGIKLDVITKASLADAFELVLHKSNVEIIKNR